LGESFLAGQKALACLAAEVASQPVPRRGVARIDRQHLAVKRVGLLERLGCERSQPPPASQNPDVELNVRPGQIKKINIAVPDFTLVTGPDPQNWAKRLPEITSADLTFTSLFSVVSGTPALPQGGAEALKPRLQEFAAAGALRSTPGSIARRG
jgi:hypothetical protein